MQNAQCEHCEHTIPSPLRRLPCTILRPSVHYSTAIHKTSAVAGTIGPQDSFGFDASTRPRWLTSRSRRNLQTHYWTHPIVNISIIVVLYMWPGHSRYV